MDGNAMLCSLETILLSSLSYYLSSKAITNLSYYIAILYTMQTILCTIFVCVENQILYTIIHKIKKKSSKKNLRESWFDFPFFGLV